MSPKTHSITSNSLARQSPTVRNDWHISKIYSRHTHPYLWVKLLSKVQWSLTNVNWLHQCWETISWMIKCLCFINKPKTNSSTAQVWVEASRRANNFYSKKLVTSARIRSLQFVWRLRNKRLTLRRRQDVWLRRDMSVMLSNSTWKENRSRHYARLRSNKKKSSNARRLQRKLKKLLWRSQSRVNRRTIVSSQTSRSMMLLYQEERMKTWKRVKLSNSNKPHQLYLKLSSWPRSNNRDSKSRRKQKRTSRSLNAKDRKGRRKKKFWERWEGLSKPREMNNRGWRTLRGQLLKKPSVLNSCSFRKPNSL